MTLDDLLPPDADPKTKDLFQNHIFLVVAGLVLLTSFSSQSRRPAWLKDLPPLGGKVAGPWRGKGSFGRGFGPQTSR